MKVVCYRPWRAASLLWQPSPGAWAFTVACHAVFELAPNESPVVRKPLPLDPVADDDDRAFVEPWGPPAPLKRHPEVIVVGHAYAPPARPVTSLVARLAVGDLEKLVHVHGDSWFTREGVVAAPLSFAKMPLRWERAAGAPDESNPVGVAMGKHALADTQGRVLLPNLRPMGTWITSRDEVLPPVGFGPVRPTWPSRLARLHHHAASWDPQRWAEQPLPPGFDVSYFNVAPPNQELGSITGSERLLLEHLHPRFPRLATYLAAAMPCVVASLEGVEQNVPVVCDTMVIDSDRGLVFLVWRGHVPLSHPQQEGMVFVSTVALSSTGTVEGTSVPPKPALPFRAVPEDAPSVEVSGDAESVEKVDEADADPPTLRRAALTRLMAAKGDTQPPQAAAEASPPPAVPPPVAAPPVVVPPLPVVAPAPPIVAPAILHPLPALEPVVPPPPPAALPPPPPRAASREHRVARSVEHCAAFAARLASSGANRIAILEAEGLTPEEWEREHVRWLGEINDELDRGNRKLHDLVRERRARDVDLDTQQVVDLVFEQHQQMLAAYDAAYVAALEELRGPIAPAEFARLSRAADVGEAAPVLVELRLPEGAMSRIRRVWRAKMAEDPSVAAEVGAALRAPKP